MPIEYNRLPEIIAGIEPGVEAALTAACVLIEDGSRERARVLSGDMKDGFRYQVFPGFWAEVWNIEEHAIYNELGTKHMSSQPMMRPAVMETEDKFLEALKLVYEV